MTSLKNVQPDPRNGIPHLYEFSVEDGASSMETDLVLGYRKIINFNSDVYYVNSNGNSVRYDGRVWPTLSNTNQSGDSDLNFSTRFNYSTDSFAVRRLANLQPSTVTQTVGAYEKYWEQYIEHLYQSGARKIKCDAFFKPSDYRALNIQDTVHIDGNDYLINKISGFNLSRPDVVEVELITYNNNFVNVFTEPRNRFIEDDSIGRTHIVGIQAIGYDGEPTDAASMVIEDAIQVKTIDTDGNEFFLRLARCKW